MSLRECKKRGQLARKEMNFEVSRGKSILFSCKTINCEKSGSPNLEDK